MVGFTKPVIIASWLFCTPILSAPATCSGHSLTSTTTTISKPTPTVNTASTHESGGEEHIVIVDKNAPIPPRVAEVLKRLDLDEQHPDVRHIFNNSAFHGFAASMKSHCLDLLANMTDVSMVEKAATIQRADVLPYDTRPNAPWGLQSISTSSFVSGSPESMDYTYSYTDSSLGSGADIYIIDTGLYTQHNVFNGRAQTLWSFDTSPIDNDGHGTHTAGTAAGSILGVASNANVFGIKALDATGGGWSSDVVAAISQAVQSHDARRSLPGFIGSVMSMSLASPGTVNAISTAVEGAIAAGLHACVAAGNDNTDACSISPASSGGTNGNAITVGAVDIDTNIASFSNHGDCVDVYAPGVDIISAWIGQPNMVNILSGTSMATPHVTGIVAYTMAQNKTLADNPGLMKEWIRMNALRSSQGLLLANNGVQAGGGIDSKTTVNDAGVKKVEWKRSFSGLDSSGKCARSSVLGAWLCNAKRGITRLSGIVHR